MPQQPADSQFMSRISGLPVLRAVLCGLACAVTMPIRYGEGLVGIGRNGFFAALVIFGYALLAPCPPLMLYGLAFIALAAIKRPIMLLCHFCGYRQMSVYEGTPLLCLVGIPEGIAKRVIEPGLVYLLGWYLRFSNPALGCFFIAGAAATALKATLSTVALVNRDLAASDLRIQMEIDARRRSKRGW